MDAKKVVCVLAAGFCLQVGTAWAAAACSVNAAEDTRGSAGTFARSTTDPASGAVMELRREESGHVVVELHDKVVSIRREFSGALSTTTLTSGGRHVVITIGGNDVTVAAQGKVLKGNALVANSLNEPLKYLHDTAEARAAKALVDRTTFDAESIEGNALLLTKALLGSIWGDTAGTLEYQRWASARTKAPKVVAARVGIGPGECWDLYSQEAMRIGFDFVDCANTCNWSAMFCMGGCGFIYDIRAEAAFMWFMNCSGRFFVE